MKFVKNREGEKGAALVMVVMITMLLLAAVGGLLLEVSMNTANVTDATAEQQAYNAAESGIQSSINVLRQNTVPSALLDPSKPASDTANLIDFRKAVTPTSSNLVGETTTVARLSRWMTYNYTPSGNTLADRVTLNPAADYQPYTGYAFGVEVSDPDKTGNIINYKVQGKLYDPIQRKWTSDPVTVNGVTISYQAPLSSSIVLDVSSGHAAADYGTFRVTGAGELPDDGVRFEIVVTMTAPYSVARGIRGYVKSDDPITSSNVSLVDFEFDSQVSQLMGSTITLDNNPMHPDGTGGVNITADMTQAEPFRVVVSAVGYGPRGAKKVLEATIQKNFFNGMTSPATLMLVGPQSKNGVDAVFEPGSSAVTEYSGQDVASSIMIPPIGTTNDANLETVLERTSGEGPQPFNGTITGTSANVDSELPFWLQNPANLNGTVESLKLTAQKSGTYYADGQTPTVVGDNATARGLTFVDGDLTLTPTMGGGGILVVTGKLTLHGNFNFNGLILVTGAGGIERSGGGTGILQGNIIVAPYDKDDLNAGFLPPHYDLSGGGNSGVIYNSSSVANGMVAVSNFVLAVAEK